MTNPNMQNMLHPSIVYMLPWPINVKKKINTTCSWYHVACENWPALSNLNARVLPLTPPVVFARFAFMIFMKIALCDAFCRHVFSQETTQTSCRELQSSCAVIIWICTMFSHVEQNIFSRNSATDCAAILTPLANSSLLIPTALSIAATAGSHNKSSVCLHILLSLFWPKEYLGCHCTWWHYPRIMPLCVPWHASKSCASQTWPFPHVRPSALYKCRTKEPGSSGALF